MCVQWEELLIYLWRTSRSSIWFHLISWAKYIEYVLGIGFQRWVNPSPVCKEIVVQGKETYEPQLFALLIIVGVGSKENASGRGNSTLSEIWRLHRNLLVFGKDILGTAYNLYKSMEALEHILLSESHITLQGLKYMTQDEEWWAVRLGSRAQMMRKALCRTPEAPRIVNRRKISCKYQPGSRWRN